MCITNLQTKKNYVVRDDSYYIFLKDLLVIMFICSPNNKPDTLCLQCAELLS